MLLGLLSLSFTTLLSAQSTNDVTALRERILFNDDWRFQKGDPQDLAEDLGYSRLKPWLLPTANDFTSKPSDRPEGDAPGENLGITGGSFDDSNWRSITLPHDWGIEGAFDQKLPGETAKLPWFGVAWYRKDFELPASDKGRRIFLTIDGAMSFSAVWCNGSFVGGWPFGYASYQLDLTPFLKPGGTNTIAIRLDNPENSSRWYPGGGIYRNVWLEKTSPIHVVHWGTSITTPEVSPKAATIHISNTIANDLNDAAQVEVATQIFKLSPQGKSVGPPLATSKVTTLSVDKSSRQTIDTRIQLADPARWDITSPNRHLAVTLVRHQDKLVDRFETPFGIRTIRFTGDDGFHLNGRRVPLQGVCLHHDLGALGAAFNTRAAERQLEIMKEMGCNAIRIAHNPPAPEFLDLCDRMGLLVVDEFVDTWTYPKKPNGYAMLFSDWAEADWRSIIRRDRNHPSVILWSTGNEVGEQRDPKRHHISERLSAIAREEDPTRLSTAGCDKPDAGRNGFQKTIDVFGYNYKPHEYASFRKANPDQPLYGSETASTVSSRGEYLFPVGEDKAGGKIGFQMSSYDLYAPPWAGTPDTEFKGQDENPSVAGEFVWTGFDYLGEPTPFNNDLTILTNFHTPEARAAAEKELEKLGKVTVPSRSSYFGIVDLAGFRKDRFYLYQSRWRPELPMAHILPHWNWPDRIDQVTPVHVYTSGDEAELFLNGQSLGKRKKGRHEYRLRWDDVIYQPGTLKVVAYKDGTPWAEASTTTTGTASDLTAEADRSTILSDGRDLSFVTVSVTDSGGHLVPRSAADLKFEITGPGEIIATDNGNPTDHTSFQSTERKAFNGLALVIVRAKPGETGEIRVRAISPNLESTETLIKSVQP